MGAKRTKALSAAALFLIFAVAAATSAVAQDVILILLDDIGVGDLAIYGEGNLCSGSQQACLDDGDCQLGETCTGHYPITPNIDVLRSESLLFRNAWSMPGCVGTRTTIHTGRYGFRTGVLGNNGPLLLQYDERTIPEVMDDPILNPKPGYAQAAIGKWHLGGGNFGPNDHGWAHYAGSLSNLGPSGYFSWLRTVNGVTGVCSPGSPTCPVTSYATSVQTLDAIDWIENQTAPYFLYLAFNAPHSPMHVPPYELVSDASLAQLPRDLNGDLQPPGYACVGDERRVCFEAMIEAADASIGQLLASLTRPTTVILLGDNGTPKQMTVPPFDPQHAKATVYEGGVHVPMLIRHADGLSAGMETAALVHTVDLFSTVLDLVGANPPDDRPIDGRSIVPVLHDPGASIRALNYTERYADKAVRGGRYKLIYRPAFEELYSLTDDRFELDDLLAGQCSDDSGDCHLDGDCPLPEICVAAQLDHVALQAYTDLRAWLESNVDHPGGEVPEDSLSLFRSGANLILDWDASCRAADLDYAVYEGALGRISSMRPVTCATEGTTSWQLPISAQDAFYLVVPHTGWREGSYGRASDGTPRPAASRGCFPQQVGEVCE